MDSDLEARAQRAYQAFCDSARAFLPPCSPEWSTLPEVLKKAWKAAAAAVLESA